PVGRKGMLAVSVGLTLMTLPAGRTIPQRFARVTLSCDAEALVRRCQVALPRGAAVEAVRGNRDSCGRTLEHRPGTPWAGRGSSWRAPGGPGCRSCAGGAPARGRSRWE